MSIRSARSSGDIEFHQSLNDGAGNRLLAALAQGLYDIGLEVRRVASSVPGTIEKSVAQHIEVADAVMAKDAKAAKETQVAQNQPASSPPPPPAAEEPSEEVEKVTVTGTLPSVCGAVQSV